MGQIIQERGEKEQSQDHGEPGENAGQTGHGPGLEIHGGAGEGPGSGVTLADSPQNVGQPLADELLVGVQPLAGFSGHGLGNGDGLHEAQQGDDGGIGEEGTHDFDIDLGQRKTWQPFGDLPHHRPPAFQGDFVLFQQGITRPDPPGPTVGLSAGWDFRFQVIGHRSVRLLHPGEEHLPDLAAELGRFVL